MSVLRTTASVTMIAVLFGLASCASVLKPDVTPSLPPKWRHAQQQDQALPADLAGWWHAFHDRQLDTLVDTALCDNLDLGQAREHLLAARTLASRQSAQHLPYLRAKTDDVIDPDGSASFFVVGFDALWELPLFGRLKATHEQAQGTLDASSANLQAARVSLVAEVVRQWLQLRAAQQDVQALTAVRDARVQQLKLLRIRQQLTLASDADVQKAQAAADRAEAAVAPSTAEIDAHAQSLAALLGRTEPDPQWLQPGPLPDLGALSITSTPADMLRTRPEIAQAQAEVLRAVGDARLARADLFPRIGLGGSIVWSSKLITHRPTTDDGIASAGPYLDIPLFDWGLRQSKLAAQNHQIAAAAFAYRQAVLDGVAEVETALGQLEQAHIQQQASINAAQALDQALAQADTRVQLGLETPIARCEDSAESAQARLEATQAQATRDLAFVRLYKALGGAPLPSAEDNH